MVNLIPFNPIPGSSFKRPEPGVVAAFRDQLDRAGVPVRMRMAKGDDMLAACGQLATASV
jgi:23S rRNA (adenine2503-C2)-methyltransferase